MGNQRTFPAEFLKEGYPNLVVVHPGENDAIRHEMFYQRVDSGSWLTHKITYSYKDESNEIVLVMLASS